jgi:hypothetical protein
MKRKVLMFFVSFITSVFCYSQQLPVGTCGLVYTYDAAGNRLKRVYFCNNGTDPYPSRKLPKDTLNRLQLTEEVQMVDALFPNPTTGLFFITFSKELKNARVLLTDMSGKVVQQSVGNGYRLSFDLSRVASGTYIVRIEEEGMVITKKVIKQ